LSRTKIIARLEEQKLILKDPNHTRTVRNWVKKDGERLMVEKQQRVPLWVAATPKRQLCIVRSVGIEANGVRKGEGGNRRAVTR